MQRGKRDFLNRTIMVLDKGQRCLRGIHEFSSDPDCIYRLSIEDAPRDTTLPDGTVFRRGDPIGILHIWGEHVPEIPASGVNLAWAARMIRVLRRSANLLAQHAAKEKALQSIAAYGNDAFFPNTQTTVRLLERMGFAVLEEVPSDRLHQQIHTRISQLWTWLLRRAFNQQSTRRVKPSDLQSLSIWLSRRTLLERYITCEGSYR
jgi:hypothetical protein